MCLTTSARDVLHSCSQCILNVKRMEQIFRTWFEGASAVDKVGVTTFVLKNYIFWHAEHTWRREKGKNPEFVSES